MLLDACHFNHPVFTIFLLLGMGILPAMVSAACDPSAAEIGSSTVTESPVKNESVRSGESLKLTKHKDASLVRAAAERRTPLWTNDGANMNNKLPPTSPTALESPPYSASKLTVSLEWKKLFADDDHFSTTGGKELCQSMYQACHMPDGQGARGAGIYPYFVGNERLRSACFTADVILNELRGTASFGEKLSN